MMDDDFDADFDARAERLFRELSEDAFDQAQPLPPSQVRRLGDRRRTRRRVGIASAALGVSLVAGTAFLTRPDTARPSLEAAGPSSVASTASTTKPSLPSVSTAASTLPTSTAPASPSTSQTPSATPVATVTVTTTATPKPTASASSSTSASAASSAPSATPTKAAAGVTTDLLPATQLIYWQTPGDLQQTGQYSGNEAWASRQEPLSYCEQDKANLGQRNVVWRTFAGVGSGAATVAIFDFDSEQQAIKARMAMRDWYATCKARQITKNGQDGDVTTATELNVDGPNLAGLTPNVSHRQVRWAEKGAADSMWEDVTIFFAGNRLMAVVQTVYAPEIGCSVPAKDGQRLCSTAAKASALTDRLASR